MYIRMDVRAQKVSEITKAPGSAMLKKPSGIDSMPANEKLVTCVSLAQATRREKLDPQAKEKPLLRAFEGYSTEVLC